MERRGCVASAISLFRLGVSPIDFAEHLLAQDVIYVTGGSMVNLLALWREHRIDEIMRAAHERGIVLCGYSAGSMCWFEHGDLPRRRSAGAGRGARSAVAGSHCVHYSQDPARRDAYRRLIAATARSLPGLALDDHAAALIRGRRAGRGGALARERAAYRVGAGEPASWRDEIADRDPPAAAGRRSVDETGPGRDARAPPRPLGAGVGPGRIGRLAERGA